MGTYTERVKMYAMNCCKCGITFAVPDDWDDRRRSDHGQFYCPAGHPQYYGSESDEERLRRQLREAQHQAQAQQEAKIRAQSERDAAQRRYSRIRDRVKNGVCPCCNRTFENLARHMATKHPDFGTGKSLKALRTTYGLTQVELAREAGVTQGNVSAFENQRPVPEYAASALEEWMGAQA